MDDKNCTNFPYEFRNLNSNELEEMLEMYNGVIKEFIYVGPKGYLTPKGYVNHATSIYNMPLRPRDVFVVTFQRSGTTLTQELVWLLVRDFDYETAKSTLLNHRYPFLEFPIFMDEKAMELLAKRIGDSEKAKEMLKEFARLPSEILAETPDPRFIKTHLPLSLLPPQLLDIAKVVYVARDPRDVVVSLYHQTKLFVHLGLQGNFKQFWNLFIKDLLWYAPYFEHVKEAWAQRNHPNMLFLFFEDLKKDLPTNIVRISKFLGKKKPTKDQIKSLSDHLNIDNFKNNKSVNFEEMRPVGMLNENERFIRSGKAGGWREYFDEEMIKQAESWIMDNLRDTDLRFPSMQDIYIR